MLKYSYKASIKSKLADELLNTYFIRPFAGVFVSLLYNTKILPIQVVVFGSILGLIGAFFFSLPGYNNLLIGAIFLFAKNISDAVDGQLARAKNQVDRRGRFLDSIADIIINFFVFFALAFRIFNLSGDPLIFLMSFISFLSLSIRVSYFVFYEVSYLKLENKMNSNRIIETITEEDKLGDKVALILQRIFNFFYMWQDNFIFEIDKWSKSRILKYEDNFEITSRWYSDKLGLRLGNFIGLGTELTLLMIMCLINEVYLYLFLNIFMLNFYLLFIILYRKLYLAKKVYALSEGR